MVQFPSVSGVNTSINPRKYYNDSLTFYFDALNANFDLDVSVAYAVAKCAVPGKVMQGSPCPEVRTLTNENGRFIMKLNDLHFLAEFLFIHFLAM